MTQPILKSLRTAFVAGVIVLAPLAVTVYVFKWLVGAVGGNYRDYFFFFVPRELLTQRQLIPAWDFLATLIVFMLVTLLGYLSRYVVARFFLIQAERIMNRVPLISVVYNTVKQIVQTFSMQRRAVFEKVVLVPFPRPGVYAIGFLTNKAQGEAQARTAEELWNIFVPTTPNPTSGFLIMVPKRDIIEMDMTIGEGMKLIISGGGVVPEWPAPIIQPAVAPAPGSVETPEPPEASVPVHAQTGPGADASGTDASVTRGG